MESSLKTQDSKKNFHKWISNLGNTDGGDRLKARSALIREGVNAVPDLIQALTDNNQHVRWEAAKALASIKDASAAPALVVALMDDDHDVRWAAMKALTELDRAGLESLLQALIMDFDSVWLREGAHHVLNVLKKRAKLREPSLNVLRALDGVEPEMTVAGAAEAAWERLYGVEKERTI